MTEKEKEKGITLGSYFIQAAFAFLTIVLAKETNTKL